MNQVGDGFVISIQGRAATVRLTKPKILNAVTQEVIAALEALYHRIAKDPNIYGVIMEAEGKAFSAGGDIRTIRDWIVNDLPRADRFYAEEYQHNWTLQCFRKPH